MIAESPFASLDHAVANHFALILGRGGPLLGLPTRWIGERFIGKNCADIAPVREIARIAPRPLLLIEDSNNQLCSPAETQALFREAGASKQIGQFPARAISKPVDVQPDAYAHHR